VACLALQYSATLSYKESSVACLALQYSATLSYKGHD
jgi:hypothetical protein